MFVSRPFRRSTTSVIVIAGFALAWASPTSAHDIPNARIDRAIQVSLAPGRLQIRYEVSLAELTLAQDLRQLDGEGFIGERSALFERYARVVGPLNARGLLASVDEQELQLQPVDFTIAIEDHLRISFVFESQVPDGGRLSIIDTNYASSEGSSRLGLRFSPSIEVAGEIPPAEVDSIPPRLPWELTDAEERRTKSLRIQYKLRGDAPSAPDPKPLETEPLVSSRPTIAPGLTRFLDHRTPWVAVGWWLTAMFLGMAHAVQPGHGKTLVAAASLGGPNAASRGVALGLMTAVCHLLGVFAIAAILWWIPSQRFAAVHVGFARGSGILVAVVGMFRVGRALGGIEPKDHTHLDRTSRAAYPSLWTLGLAGGFVPCWDGVALVVLAGSLGQVGWGILLLVAFSIGLGSVLAGVGLIAGRVQSKLKNVRGLKPSLRWLRLVSGIILTVIGVGLLNS